MNLRKLSMMQNQGKLDIGGPRSMGGQWTVARAVERT